MKNRTRGQGNLAKVATNDPTHTALAAEFSRVPESLIIPLKIAVHLYDVPSSIH